MAWCPKCKNEYREGFSVCAECGCELVEKEKIYNVKPLAFGEEQQMISLKGFLEYNKIKYVEMKYDEEEAVYELLVDEDDLLHAQKVARVFLEQRTLEKLKEAQEYGMDAHFTESYDTAVEATEEAADNGNSSEISKPYVNSADQAEENRSSAWTLLVVGSIGLIVVILGIAGIIPFRLGNPYMFYGVMSAIFILFIVMGMLSMKNAKVFAKKAESENSLRDSLLKWCRENLTAQKVNEQLGNTDNVPEEVLYFRRYEMIRKMMNHQFMNLDQGFLENLIDEEVYDMVFSDDVE